MYLPVSVAPPSWSGHEGTETLTASEGGSEIMCHLLHISFADTHLHVICIYDGNTYRNDNCNFLKMRSCPMPSTKGETKAVTWPAPLPRGHPARSKPSAGPGYTGKRSAANSHSTGCIFISLLLRTAEHSKRATERHQHYHPVLQRGWLRSKACTQSHGDRGWDRGSPRLPPLLPASTQPRSRRC